MMPLFHFVLFAAEADLRLLRRTPVCRQASARIAAAVLFFSFMASFLIQPFQPSGQIVTDEDEQSHDRQIVDKEEDQRFAVIKKHEMSPQEKVFSKLPAAPPTESVQFSDILSPAPIHVHLPLNQPRCRRGWKAHHRFLPWLPQPAFRL